jgi:hypothetical protein
MNVKARPFIVVTQGDMDVAASILMRQILKRGNA